MTETANNVPLGYTKTLEGLLCKECYQHHGANHLEGCSIAELLGRVSHLLDVKDAMRDKLATAEDDARRERARADALQATLEECERITHTPTTIREAVKAFEHIVRLLRAALAPGKEGEK